MPEKPTEPIQWPLAQYDAMVHDTAIATRMLLLLLNRKMWIHSVVHSIEYRDDRTVHYGFQTDFTVPTAAQPPRRLLARAEHPFLPIATLPKGQLIGFDIRDGRSRPVPYLLRRHTSALAAAILPLYASSFLGTGFSAHLAKHLEEVAKAPLRQARDELDIWQRGRCGTCSGDDLLATAELFQHPAFTGVLSELASNYMLIVVTAERPGERLCIDHSYDARLRLAASGTEDFASPLPTPSHAPSAAKQIFRGIGWASTPFTLSTAQASTVGSYQLRVTAPEGVEIVEASLSTQLPDDPEPTPVAWTPGGSPVIQLQTNDSPSGQVFAEVRFRASRHGWLTALLASGWATAALLVIGAWRLDDVERSAQTTGNHTDTIAVLAGVLVGLTGLMASMLARSAEHALLRRLLSPLRLLALILGALPLLAATTLIFGPRGEALTVIWWLLAVVAFVLAGVFSVSCRWPKMPEEGVTPSEARPYRVVCERNVNDAQEISEVLGEWPRDRSVPCGRWLFQERRELGRCRPEGRSHPRRELAERRSRGCDTPLTRSRGQVSVVPPRLSGAAGAGTIQINNGRCPCLAPGAALGGDRRGPTGKRGRRRSRTSLPTPRATPNSNVRVRGRNPVPERPPVTRRAPARAAQRTKTPTFTKTGRLEP